MVEHLKSLELRLLRCTLPPPPNPPNPNPNPNPNSLIESLVSSIERGDYFEALASPAANLVLKFSDSFQFDNSVESAGRFYAEVERSVGAFLGSDDDTWLSFVDSKEGEDEDRDSEMDFEAKVSIVLCLGVAAFLAFTQQNVTGPVGVFSPFPISVPQLKVDGVHGGGMWDTWAKSQLTSVGCGLLGKFMHLQYIVYAKIMLSKAKDLFMGRRNSYFSGCASISWWLCRLILLQQRILDETSSSLYDQLQACKEEILNQCSQSDDVFNYWGSLLREGEAATIVSMAQLEAGILEHKYRQIDSSRLYLERAEEACGMHHYITGVLGFRTIHQVDAKAQYVLVPNTSNHGNGDGLSTNCSLTTNDSTSCKEKVDTHTQECSDVLIKPKLLESDEPGGNISSIGKDVRLTATQQAVLLAHCLHLQSRSRSDELSMWQMAPYIETIDGQHQCYFSIRCSCDILRIRWESTRSHTKERALLMMEKLVEATTKDLPLAAQRLQIAFGVYLPTIPTLRKEYGELLVRCGLIGEALKIFEDLELWDSLIFCYRLLDKKATAVDLIKERLIDMPTDPRLWCSLGDVTNSDAYYEKALEVSNNKSARAMRSLARSAYNRGDYKSSEFHWESAMSINSLYPDGWFALGAAALKGQDFDKALEAFTHAVQLDPENGEAWNNIAFLHMKNKKSKPAFVAFREALKYRRNTWQLWQNYSRVALEIGNFYQALEATKQVLNLTNNKQVDVELLDAALRVVEESAFNSTARDEGHDAYTPKTDSCHSAMDSSEVTSFSSKDYDLCVGQKSSNESMIESSEDFGYSGTTNFRPQDSELLMNMLGNILVQLVRNGGGADIWGLYARWHKIKGDLTVCSEALLKQVRSYQGSDLWHDRDRFKKFAQASLQLCKVYMEIASSTGSRRELIMAEMHLRNSVKQAVNFLNTEEFCDLQACHEEVKKRLDPIPM